MPLTEEQEGRLVSWCTARGICARCSMCGNNDWSTGEIISPLPGAGAGEFIEAAASMVQIICDHCKLVMLFAAAPILGEHL